MKKKQLFAVLLAGSMTVGMAPAAAFAAEETTQAETQVTDENTENTDTAEADAAAAAEAQKQAEEQAAADAAAKAQEEAEAQAEADAQAAAEAQAKAEEQAAAEAQAKAEEQAAAEAAAKAAEAKANGTVVTDEKGLNAAIEAAETVDTTNTAVTEAEPTKIVINGTIKITTSVTIPTGKSIAILGADDQAVIQRADGFTGNLFEVSAGSAFYMAKKDATDSEPAGTLEVNGSVTDGTAVEGSLVHVAAGANFSMTTGITLCNNNTTAKGAAIFNEGGNALITGGTITENKSDNGAVYSTGTISVKKGDDATDVEPNIADNTKTDGKTQANVILSGEGKIEIKGAITAEAKIGFSVEDPQADREVIKKADDFTDNDAYAEALKVLASQYEGDTTKFKVDETTGKLVSTETPVEKPKVTIKSTKWESGTKGTAVITSDKAGQLYYKCVAKGAAAPTIDTTGTGTAVKAGDNTINLTNLSGKEMVLYVCVKGADGSVSDPVNATITLTETPVEPVKKPVVTIKSTKWESGTKGTAVITSDKAGKLYYKCVAKGAAAPKKDTSGAGKAIKAGEATTINLTNLSGKEMDLYVWVKGSDGSVSDQAKKTIKKSAATKIDIHWKGLEWSGNNATVTLSVNVDGTCYYKVVECDENGNSKTPDKSTIKETKSVSANKVTGLQLQNVSTSKAYDLYLYIKAKDGTTTTIKRIELRYGHTPVVPKVTESKLKGLNNGMEFPVGIFYEFQVIGAGTTNKNPGEGDVKWEPLYWSTVANPEANQMKKTWKIGATKKSSQDTFNLNLYVFFKKWVYTNGQWVETDTVESALYQIKSAKVVDAAGSGTPNPDSTDGLSGTDPNATVTGEASATAANGDGTTSRSAVSTADNSPIGTMSALAVASLIAGGYVIVRRRKKGI